MGPGGATSASLAMLGGLATQSHLSAKPRRGRAGSRRSMVATAASLGRPMYDHGSSKAVAEAVGGRNRARDEHVSAASWSSDRWGIDHQSQRLVVVFVSVKREQPAFTEGGSAWLRFSRTLPKMFLPLRGGKGTASRSVQPAAFSRLLVPFLVLRTRKPKPIKRAACEHLSRRALEVRDFEQRRPQPGAHSS